MVFVYLQARKNFKLKKMLSKWLLYRMGRIIMGFLNSIRSYVFLLLVGLSINLYTHNCHAGVFVGYEMLEMIGADYKNFAGEVGYRWGDGELRFVGLDVQLNEDHLTSDYAKIVEGSGVEGELKGYELYSNWYFSGNWYYMFNIGYIKLNFHDKISGEWYRNDSLMAGSGIGYNWRQPFGIPGLYINPHFPFRFLFDPIEQKQFTKAKVMDLGLAFNVWLFVGMEF